MVTDMSISNVLPRPQPLAFLRASQKAESLEEPFAFKCPTVWQGKRPLIESLICDYGHLALDDLQGTYGWCIRYSQKSKQDALEISTLGELLELYRNGSDAALPYLMHLSINRNLPAFRHLFVPPPEFEPNWVSSPVLDRIGGPELFFGQKGTGFGPIHIDHVAVHVGFYQFEGSKRFLLFPPSDGQYLYLYRGAQFPWQLRNSRLSGFDEETCCAYPLLRKTHPREITLRAGEALFMPANWWHTTYNLTNSASYSVRIVNHTNAIRTLTEYAKGVPRFFASA